MLLNTHSHTPNNAIQMNYMCVCVGGAYKYKYAYNDITENTENRVKSYSYSHYPTKTSLTV